MGKRSGLGQGFWLDGYDISGDVGALAHNTAPSNEYTPGVRIVIRPVFALVSCIVSES